MFLNFKVFNFTLTPFYSDPFLFLVAEGAGQKFFEGIDLGKDSSGNIKLKEIGLFLKEKITSYFAAKKIELSLK